MSREILFGKNVLLSLLKAKRRKIYKIFWGREERNASSADLLQKIEAEKIPLQKLSNAELTQQFKTQDHQGLAIEVAQFQYAELAEVAKKADFLILLDEIQDPHNVGALIRTAHLCGASGLVLLKHRSGEVNPTVCKVATGAQEFLPIIKETNLVQVIQYLKEKDFLIVGASSDGGVSIYKADLHLPIALVLGNENKGLRRLVKENCDLLVSIPMLGEVGSFNVSVAGGILMAEIMRKLRLSP